MIFPLSILSASAFWAGGRYFGNKLIRRLICPFLLLVGIWGYFGCDLSLWWAYLAILALNIGAISTYWDFLGIDKGDHREETPLCWFMSGIGYGLAAIPTWWLGVNWYAILLRTIVLGVGIWFIRKIENVHISEPLSGFLYLITLPILMI